MKVLISGYLLAEGRFSMVRTGRTLYRYLRPMLDPNDTVALDEASNGNAPVPHYTRKLSVKLRKRLVFPLHLRMGTYDVLHVVDSDYAAAIPPSKRRRTVVTCHDMIPFLTANRLEVVFPGRAGLYLYKKGLKVMAQCARISVPSKFTCESVLKYTECREEQVQVIYEAAEECFRPLGPHAPQVTAFLERHNLEGKRVILHVGTADVYKNIETVLAVFKKLLDKGNSNLMLLKVGSPFSAGHESIISRLGLSTNVTYVSRVSEDELISAYNIARLLLYPSEYEGFGYPILEAMSCGTPVVCSNGGSLAEVAGGAAAVHSPEDVDGLVESCQRVFEDESYRERLRELGMMRAAEFSWTRTAQKYYEIYKSVMAEKQ